MPDTTKSARSTKAKGKSYEGFTDAERGAMKERAKELKAGSGKEDDENAGLVKIGEMSDPDRALGERLHAIITASAPALSPRPWYGMPAYARDGKVVCFSRPRTSSTSAMRPSAWGTGRSWTTGPCGRPPSRCRG